MFKTQKKLSVGLQLIPPQNLQRVIQINLQAHVLIANNILPIAYYLKTGRLWQWHKTYYYTVLSGMWLTAFRRTFLLSSLKQNEICQQFSEEVYPENGRS
jgi:hypothetical protein